MKNCKICDGKKDVVFLGKYRKGNLLVKAFQSLCKTCGDDYIFFVKKDREGNIEYTRTFA